MYRTLIAQMINGFALHEIICDEAGKPCDYRFIEVNSAFEEITGLKAEEIVGKSVLEILPQLESYWIDNFGMVALTGESVQIENYAQEFDKYFEVLAYSTQKGQFATVFTDRTEQRKMQDEILRAQKLESIGILAGGIAHDFNNLLSIIMGNIDLVKNELKPEADISALLAETEKASFQAQELTQQLITFSKGGAPVKNVSSIKELVKEIKKSSILGSNIKCEFTLAPDLWFVEFDEGQMNHAINNMIVNAEESMPDGGTIHLRAENFNLSAGGDLPFPEGRYVKISIRDHGVGIPEKHLSMIFDPYFSTKEMGLRKGMGLGLTTTYSIINRHGGYIIVESEVGVGTTFTINLPAHEKEISE